MEDHTVNKDLDFFTFQGMRYISTAETNTMLLIGSEETGRAGRFAIRCVRDPYPTIEVGAYLVITSLHPPYAISLHMRIGEGTVCKAERLKLDRSSIPVDGLFGLHPNEHALTILRMSRKRLWRFQPSGVSRSSHCNRRPGETRLRTQWSGTSNSSPSKRKNAFYTGV